MRALVYRASSEVPARQCVTARFRRRLVERVRGGAAHAEVAREEHTTGYQVARAFRAAREQLRTRRGAQPARRLSLDEAHHRRRHELVTVVSDLDRRSVIEVLDGRSRRRIERYLGSLPRTRDGRSTWSRFDPYDGYRQAIRARLPHARIVCDHFHLVRGANTALDAGAPRAPTPAPPPAPEGRPAAPARRPPGGPRSTASATAC
jgi:transposase